MTTSYERDQALAKRTEAEVLQILKKEDPEVQKTIDRYHRFDFISHKNRIVYELKARNVYKDQYPTTIVGYDKIEYYEQNLSEYDCIFLFYFKDGLYYCQYDNDLEYEVRPFVRNARPEIRDRKKDYCFIPVSQLKRY
jgi:hypothetical protein